MRNARLLAIAALIPLLMSYTATLGAEGPPAPADVEWVVTLGCRHCHFAELTGVTKCVGNCGPAALRDGKVVTLTGAAVPKDFKKGGRWLVKGTPAADGTGIAVKVMTPQLPTPEELKDDRVAPPASDAKAYSGTVGSTGAGLPTLAAADGGKYGLKPSKSASLATRQTLTRIGGSDLTGAFTVTGTTYADDSRTWVVVDTIAPAGKSGDAKAKD